MTYRSSWDVLLRVRRGLERQQELLLQAANGRVAAVQRELDNIQIQIALHKKREQQQLQSGLSAAELQFDQLCQSTLQAQCCVVAGELSEAQAAQRLRAQAFRRARQEREILETLQQQRLLTYHQRVARQMQRELDDLFLQRHAYLSRG